MIPVTLMYTEHGGEAQRTVFMPAAPRVGEDVTFWRLIGGRQRHQVIAVDHVIDLEHGTSKIHVRLTFIAADVTETAADGPSARRERAAAG